MSNLESLPARVLLRPQEYYYLYSPWWSDPTEMLKYTLQGLWFEGHININFRFIQIHPSEQRKRSRMFLSFGPKYDTNYPYSLAERFLISKINAEEERLFTLKHAVWRELDGRIDRYKWEYVYKDIAKKDLVFSPRFLNSRGRKARNYFASQIESIEEEVDQLLLNKDALNSKLGALGPLVVLLELTVLNKLKIPMNECFEITNLFREPEIIDDSSDGTGGSFGGGGYGGGGWGGFGGGGFGGGGSGGRW